MVCTSYSKSVFKIPDGAPHQVVYKSVFKIPCATNLSHQMVCTSYSKSVFKILDGDTRWCAQVTTPTRWCVQVTANLSSRYNEALLKMI